MSRSKIMAGFAVAGVIAGGLLISALTLAPVSQANEARDRGASPDAGQSTAHKAPKCLDSRNMGGIRVVGENLIVARDSFGNAYEMELGGPCRSMNDFSHIGFEFNGSDQICRAHDAFVLYSENDELPLRCIINSVKSISREEADKLES